MAFKLPALPYSPDALAPYLSAESFSYHHGKHHATYVKVLNELVAGTDLEGKPLEEVIKAAAGKEDKKKLFNNAGQHWNHTLYWHSISAPGSTKPDAATAKLIDASFGSFDDFAKKFVDAAVGQFGSGWAWLVLGADGKLAIQTTGNADLPLAHGSHALLTCDVWEHAYYIDSRNDRKGFVEAFVTKLANWNTVSQRIESPAESLDNAA